jgi:hypothetical protein
MQVGSRAHSAVSAQSVSPSVSLSIPSAQLPASIQLGALSQSESAQSVSPSVSLSLPSSQAVSVQAGSLEQSESSQSVSLSLSLLTVSVQSFSVLSSSFIVTTLTFFWPIATPP